MAAKDVQFGNEVRQKMVSGVNTLANAVRVTLGPKGRNVVVDRAFGGPHITKDGVTVAKEIELKDKFDDAADRFKDSKLGEQVSEGMDKAKDKAEEAAGKLKDKFNRG